MQLHTARLHPGAVGCIRSWPSVCAALDILGIADRPANALDELGSGVLAVEMLRKDALVEEHGAVRSFAAVSGDDDSGHDGLQVVLGVGSIVVGSLQRLPEGDVKLQ